jgi:hypothetical protein
MLGEICREHQANSDSAWMSAECNQVCCIQCIFGVSRPNFRIVLASATALEPVNEKRFCAPIMPALLRAPSRRTEQSIRERDALNLSGGIPLSILCSVRKEIRGAQHVEYFRC